MKHKNNEIVCYASNPSWCPRNVICSLLYFLISLSWFPFTISLLRNQMTCFVTGLSSLSRGPEQHSSHKLNRADTISFSWP